MNESAHDPSRVPANPPTPPAPAPLQTAAPAKKIEPRAFRSLAAWLFFLIPALLGLTADLGLKAYSFPNGVPTAKEELHRAGRHPPVDPNEPFDVTQKPRDIIPNVLGFTTTVNQGAVFGIGQGKVPLFLAFSFAALGIIVWVFTTSAHNHRVVHLSLGLITAGALGNLYDRALYGGVRDMLRLLCLNFPPVQIFGFRYPSGPLAPDGTADWYPFIFNLADVFLCLGVPLLIIRWMAVKEEKPNA